MYLQEIKPFCNFGPFKIFWSGLGPFSNHQSKKNYESKVWNYKGFGRHYPIDMKGIYNNQNILKETNM